MKFSGFLPSLLLIFAVSEAFGAKNLILNGSASRHGVAPLNGFAIVQDGNAADQYCFQAKAGRSLGKDFIAVDPDKDYILSGRFRNNGQSGRFVLGLDCYDAKKRKIGSHHVQFISDTLTELTAPARKGEKNIKIKDGSAWAKIPGKIVVFNAKKDLSDLPNFNTHYYVEKVEKAADCWIVSFTRPLLRNYPAATAVRMHSESGTLKAIPFILPTRVWTTHKALIGKVAIDTALGEHLWAGTRFVKLNFYLYPGKDIMINDLQLQESAPLPTVKTAEYEYRGSKLFSNFKPMHVTYSDKSEGFWNCKFNSYGILSGEKLNWPADKIKQLELKIAAQGSPGYVMMVFNAVADGKKHTGTMRHSLNPDGKIHTLLFRTNKEGSWKGIIKDIKFYYYALDPGEMQIHSIYGRTQENLITDAENIPAGKPVQVSTLWPRGKYVLSFEGEKNPGAVLELLDCNHKTIRKIELAADKKEIGFTMPAMAADARLFLKQGGKGIPFITQKSWLERHQMPIKWNAQWIWCSRKPEPENTTVYFRKKFYIDSEVKAATAALSVDDKFKFYVNGKYVGDGWPYFITFRFDFAEHLKKGENELVIEAYNGASWGGAVLEGYIRTDKQEMSIVSDSSWDYFIGGNALPAKYTAKAVELGPADKAYPWGNRITLRHIGKAAELEITAVKNNTFQGRVLTVPAIKRDRMRMKAVARSGRTWYINPEIKVTGGKWQQGSVITIKYSAPYPELEEYTLYCADDFFKIKNDQPIGKVAAFSGKVKPLSRTVIKNSDRRPVLQVDKRYYSPLFWQFPQRYNVENYQATLGDSKYTLARINGITIYAEESMNSDGTYNFDKVSERIAVLLNENPRSLIMFCCYLYMPEWWLKKYPDHCGRDRSGKALRPGYNTALASDKWQKYVDKYLHELVNFVKKQPWGHKVMGLSLFESSNSEWFWEPGGYSAADLQAFRRHIRRKYSDLSKLRKAWNDPTVTFDNIQQPDMKKIRSGTVGALLDPLKDQYLIDWFEFRNTVFAEQIIAFARSLKKASDGKWLAGAYYGYYMECAASGRSLQDHGHNGFLEVARSPYVDFVRAPSRYIMRKLGMADGIMQMPDSFKLRNKLVYIEQDFRSYTANEREGHHGKHNNPIETVGALNRAFGMMLASGNAQYILDFGRWLYEPMLLDILRKQQQTFERLPAVKGLTPYEFAVVGPQESAYYTQKNGNFTLMNGVTAYFMRKINHLPLPFRQLALEDLLEPGLVPPLKFYVMLAPAMMTRDQRQKLLKRFDKEGASVLFLHSAGETYPNKTPSAENCADFLGIKMSMDMKIEAPQMFYNNKLWQHNAAVSPNFYPVSGFDKAIGFDGNNRPMLVKKKIGKATIYFATQMALPMELISDLAKTAGVRHYAGLNSDVWWIGNDIITLYTVNAGNKSVVLPPDTVMEQIAGPALPKKIYQSNEKIPVRASQAYVFVVKSKSHTR